MRKEPHFVITYQHLFGLVILNLIILIALILFCKLSNKAERYRDFLLSVCWLVFSWYYQLQISDHLPASIHRNHPFLECLLRSPMDSDAGYRSY